MKKLLLLLLSLPLIGNSQSGTGFAIHSDGYIATNYHVIEGSENDITVIGINGYPQENFKATVIRKDQNNDLVILKIERNLGEIPYGFKRQLEDVASNIWAYGYPLPDYQGSEIKLTTGIINSQSGYQDDPRWYQHTATIQPGNSGGPLFNKDGNLVGINNAGMKKEIATNVNYAIKARYLFNLMEDLNLSTNLNSNVIGLDINEQYKEIKKFVYIISSNDRRGNKDNITNNITAKEYYNKGLEAANNKDCYAAITFFTKAIESFEVLQTWLDATYQRASCYYNTSQYQKAVDDLEYLASIEPYYGNNKRNPHCYGLYNTCYGKNNPYYFIAKIYYERGYGSLAVKNINKAISIDSSSRDAYLNRWPIYRHYGYSIPPAIFNGDTINPGDYIPPPPPPSLLSRIFQQSIQHLRLSYSIVNKGWNSEYVTTGDPNKDLNINNKGSTYAQYGFQFKQQLWSTKNIKVLSKTDANIGAIYRGGPTLFESSAGIDFMKDEYSCGSGIMWSFGEFTPFYRIGYNNITATFITSEYGNRLMFGIGIK